jgi:hypothetical protein
MITVKRLSHNKDCIVILNQRDWNVLSEEASVYPFFIMKFKNHLKKKEYLLKPSSNVINTVGQR